MTYRIGIDIGGTFTDFALFDDRKREIVTHKSLTTPAAPDLAVLDGVTAVTRLAGVTAGDIAMIVHGTTLVTNAVIERRGASTAMIVTRGFRDVLDIACGTGYGSALLAQHAAHVTGADLSQPAVDHAQALAVVDGVAEVVDAGAAVGAEEIHRGERGDADGGDVAVTLHEDGFGHGGHR